MKLVSMLLVFAGVVAAQFPSDRDYYQQLNDAGGFSAAPLTQPDGSLVDLHVRSADYVCFSDDAHSGTFFTFTTTAYDQKYSDAQDRQRSSHDVDESLKQYAIQQAIQRTAPYVDFMPSLLFKAYPPNVQQFFRNGGRTLQETVYEKGVKTNSLQYNWDGSSWFLPNPPVDPNAYTKTSKILRLSIEPSTMRYVESTTVTTMVGNGQTAATETKRYGPWAGACEEIQVP